MSRVALQIRDAGVALFDPYAMPSENVHRMLVALSKLQLFVHSDEGVTVSLQR